ncbi:hypothetical protein LTR28_005213 [Elasticomyces elasticus]|nr:hypothetical protein LTR28_005213 [Elasticomyces elasticus]
MATRKRNEWLDAEDSDEEVEQGYTSDAVEESRGVLASRSAKRRKTETDSDAESLDEDSGPDDGVNDLSGARLKFRDGYVDDSDEGANTSVASAADTSPRTTASHPSQKDPTTKEKSKLKPLTSKQLAASQRKAQRSGVVYLSRIPPFMKPSALRHLLAPHAPRGLGRIFLTPEDPAQHTRRVRAGGNKKRSFVDGWVEFTSKKEAKMAASVLNGNIVGGKKGSWYHDDIWNVKYLRGFKWSHLTEQIANEDAERAAKQRLEISRVRQENRRFVEDVDRAKMLEGMEKKREMKKESADGDGIVDEQETVKDGVESGAQQGARREKDFRRQFRQNKVKRKGGDTERPKQPEQAQRVLSKIF